ncbi:MAG TPA: hypothetical protein VGQ15_01335 [Gaiellaceae bacterium]|jgi:hypothetical protein|nr:hypothetical protein [Gaiellaceae bacterium]
MADPTLPFILAGPILLFEARQQTGTGKFVFLGGPIVRGAANTRWADGSTFLWLARRKGVGGGEGSSGLRFDRIEDV